MGGVSQAVPCMFAFTCRADLKLDCAYDSTLDAPHHDDPIEICTLTWTRCGTKVTRLWF